MEGTRVTEYGVALERLSDILSFGDPFDVERER